MHFHFNPIRVCATMMVMMMMMMVLVAVVVVVVAAGVERESVIKFCLFVVVSVVGRVDS